MCKIRLALILLPLFIFGCSNSSTSTPAPAAPSPERQQHRLDLINEAIDLGIFDKVEMSGPVPGVWVTPLFNTLKFEDKQNLIRLVYAYYLGLDPMIDYVIVYDSRTGKEIGEYTRVHGGLQLY